MQTRSRLALAAALAVAALPVVSASAADNPVPGCEGTSFNDVPGDVQDNTAAAPQQGAPNLDVTNGFFRDEADGTLTANIQVVNLNKDVPDTATGVDWYMTWTANGKTEFVQAAVQSGGQPTFSYGEVTGTGANTLYNAAGTTGGQLFEGKDGIVQIQVPAELATGTLAGPSAQTFDDQTVGNPDVVSVGQLSSADVAPDEGAGTDYKVGGCAAAAPAPVAAPPADAGTPAQAPASNQPAAPAASAPTLRVIAKNGSARKISKARKLTIALQSSGPVSGITATLVDAKGKTVGSGKLAQLNGKGKLQVRLRKALKKGRYTLRVKSSSGAVSAALKLTR